MAASSTIEWTESTWNPMTGCTKISDGCKYCYAEKIAKRLQGTGHPNYLNGFTFTIHENMLNVPLHWIKSRIIFVNSMSDIFHEYAPVSFIKKVFNIMRSANWHIFQILTKRSERLFELDRCLRWAPNIWMGVTVENQNYAYRIDHLRETGALTKFISLEPLLGPIQNLNLNGIHWVILGGESGPNARPIKRAWVENVRDQCVESGVPFFFKQWGGFNKKKAGRLLCGRIWDEMPAIKSTCVQTALF